MLIYAVKVISIFLFAVALMRTMGKATLAQETPHDLIAIIIVGTLSAQPLATAEYGKALFGMVLVAIIPYFVFPADLASMGEQILSGRTDDSCRTWEDHQRKSSAKPFFHRRTVVKPAFLRLSGLVRD